MMKLFYYPAACSMSCHIALEETGLPFEAINLEKAPEKEKAEFAHLNPLEAVPVLKVSEKESLTQNAAILTYLAELAPKAKLLPHEGTLERAQALQWLSWVGADLHKAYGPIFALDRSFQDAAVKDAVRAWSVKNVQHHLEYADAQLKGRDFFAGSFSIADIYFFVVYNWSGWVKIPTDSYRNLNALKARVFERAATQRAMKQEGVLEG